MLIDVDAISFRKHFLSAPNPFISEPFITLNQGKVEKVIRLVEDINRPGIGLVAGIKQGIVLSPFSAPFGGFHFKKEIMYTSEIDRFLILLKEYIISHDLKGLEISLPPDIYHLTINTKVVNSFFRNEFSFNTPEITSWIDLALYRGTFTQKNSREYYKQAVRNELLFDQVTENGEKKELYDVVCENRARLGRPIFMTYENIEETAELWPIDFFKVTSIDQDLLASGIFYRSHPEICYALFWGDNEKGRPLRAMDYLVYNLWAHYKGQGYRYIDIGISTETGIPNEGLLRFKESHEATSSLKYTFSWKKS